MTARLLFACCFCDEPTADGLALVETNSETSEMLGQWWCHESCFVERLSQSSREARGHRDDPPDWEVVDGPVEFETEENGS